MAHERFASLLGGGDRRSLGHAADALEKYSRLRPELLQPFQPELLGLMADTVQAEVRWHLAVILPRLALTGEESWRVAELLQRYLEDRRSLVKTSAMQGLGDLARGFPELRAMAVDAIQRGAAHGTAAMRARGRRLLAARE